MNKLEAVRTRTTAAQMATPVKEKPEPINNTELVKEFLDKGGKLLHLRPGTELSRGMTLAFILKSGRAEVATSVTHRNDDFTKKIGTKTAIEHFNAGKTIFVPVKGHGRKAFHHFAASFESFCW